MRNSWFDLGWRNLWRDWRAGELRLLVLAVALAVAALTSVGFFSDRLQGGLQRDARQLLGGDAVLVSDQPPAAAWLDRARADGLRSVLTLSFPTMGRASDAQGGATRLVALKAVADGYPLRGQMRLTQQAGDFSGQPTRAIPARGQAWVDPALLEALGLRVGDAVLLGDASFRIAALIAQEPDRGAGFMSFAPRVMINAADLSATALVQPASRVTYRLALAGPVPAVQRFGAWAEAELKQSGVRGVRLESLANGRPEMQQTLGRAEKFLNLVVLLAALLSAVAVALAARAFAARQLDAAAMLRVLGLPQRTMAAGYALEFMLAGCAASLAGIAVGWGLHHVFVGLMAGLVDAALPAPSAWPALAGLGLGLTLLVAFGLPPVLQLAQVPPLRVLRRDVGALKAASLAVLALGTFGFAALLLALSRDRTLGLIAVGGFAGAAALFALLAWGAVGLLRRGWSGEVGPIRRGVPGSQCDAAGVVRISDRAGVIVESDQHVHRTVLGALGQAVPIDEQIGAGLRDQRVLAPIGEMDARAIHPMSRVERMSRHPPHPCCGNHASEQHRAHEKTPPGHGASERREGSTSTTWADRDAPEAGRARFTCTSSVNPLRNDRGEILAARSSLRSRGSISKTISALWRNPSGGVKLVIPQPPG